MLFFILNHKQDIVTLGTMALVKFPSDQSILHPTTSKASTDSFVVPSFQHFIFNDVVKLRQGFPGIDRYRDLAVKMPITQTYNPFHQHQ